MFTASKLKKENICQYVLYMWLVEDLARAFNFDSDRLAAYMIASNRNELAQKDAAQVDDEHIRELKTWYADIANMMLKEGLREQGHLPMVANTLLEVEELHLMLLRLGKDVEYNMAWRAVEGLVTILKSRSAKPATMGDIEMCITFIYLSMGLERTGKLNDETRASRDRISSFLGLLAKRYKAWKDNNEEFDGAGE